MEYLRLEAIVARGIGTDNGLPYRLAGRGGTG
jgi:hypothetical protein